MHSKRTKIILLALLFFGAAGGLYAWARLAPSRKEPVSLQERPLSQHRMQIKGLRFSGHHQGRKTLEIRADELTVEKMKLGHFRISLFNVARLRNAEIDIFGAPAETTGDPAPDSSTSPETQGVSFNGVLESDSIPTFGAKRISSITAEPVTVSLYDRDRLLTRVSASSAQVDLKERGITFEGDVHVVSGPREIRTGTLRFIPEKTALEVRGSYRLKTESGRTISGKGLRCNLSLQPWGAADERARVTWIPPSPSQPDQKGHLSPPMP